MTEITIPLRSHDEAILVLGPYDRYAKLLRHDLGIELFTRRGNLRIKGPDEGVSEARRRIDHLLGKARKGRELGLREIESILLSESEVDGGAASGLGGAARAPVSAARPTPTRSSSPRSIASAAREGAEARAAASEAQRGRGGPLRAAAVEPRTENQRRYLDMMAKTPLVFGLGMAGTGKTFLAVAAAVRSLRAGTCKRLVITRPVVEAGERLGFLPGDVQAKLNPYMRPIYDALNELLGFEDVMRMEELGVIEIAPLAFMRGRTLSNAFVILDEGQNTTVSQMKMFLTRLGEGSQMVVTGDPTQTDLEAADKSGLNDAVRRLRGFEDVGFCEFGYKDIVRHPLVERIVRAYEAAARPGREPRADGREPRERRPGEERPAAREP